jgi:hypothetical protein
VDSQTVDKIRETIVKYYNIAIYGNDAMDEETQD